MEAREGQGYFICCNLIQNCDNLLLPVAAHRVFLGTRNAAEPRKIGEALCVGPANALLQMMKTTTSSRALVNHRCL
ncbi:hypothetical protein E2C01_045971 [Portunus trituberculatus]|uniref:Uncharacterized protein n=1 Tax=Portunus trituberculatus TaxID=210409 RepID=A0A5B7FWJ3_PORTR|nr:hypothetical protein [Portunus trituberculatus]